MRHLTDIPMSPGLNRRSKVLSWISDSEDMFEDTGISREQTDGCELFYLCTLNSYANKDHCQMCSS